MRRTLLLLALFLTWVMPAPNILAADAAKTGKPANPRKRTAADVPATGHRVFTPADIKWADTPPSLPKGAKMFVLHGDPAAPGIFAARVRFPAGYKVPPHFHPADEQVTVLSGILSMGMGDTWDDAKMQQLPAGSFSQVPAGAHHFAGSKTGAIIQIHAMGPWGITYVNPKDDPRNQKPEAK